MKKARYTVLLLDADGTLYDFEKSQKNALLAACRQAGFLAPNTDFSKMLDCYSCINQSWWKKLERGECTKPQLQLGRFHDFFVEMGLQYDASAFNDMYMEELGNGSFLLPYAEEVCRELAKSCKLYIVTNGVSRTQRRRIGASPLAELFQGLFVSEEAGASKPEKRYFEYVFRHLGNLDLRDILLVGDSLTSDMQGAENAGLDSCWLNPSRLPRPIKPSVTYMIHDLRQLLDVALYGKQPS